MGMHEAKTKKWTELIDADHAEQVNWSEFLEVFSQLDQARMITATERLTISMLDSIIESCQVAKEEARLRSIKKFKDAMINDGINPSEFLNHLLMNGDAKVEDGQVVMKPKKKSTTMTATQRKEVKAKVYQLTDEGHTARVIVERLEQLRLPVPPKQTIYTWQNEYRKQKKEAAAA